MLNIKVVIGLVLLLLNSIFCSEVYKPKIYIDCSSCDHDFIKTKIRFVDYVIDRNEADIFIMINYERTGSGGREYKIEFTGKNDFTGRDNKIKMIISKDDSSDDRRRKIVKYLKTGLVYYISDTELIDKITVSYNIAEEMPETIDEWDNWVFTIGGNGWANGDKSYLNFNYSGYFNIKRITDEWIFENSYHASFNETQYDYGYIVKYESQNLSTGLTVIKSLTDHWSGGIASGVYNSTYSNKELYIHFSPKVEYNIFPYSESSERELRISYAAGTAYSNYYEVTIYNKSEDLKFRQTLDISLEVKKSWGNIETSVNWSNYLHDFEFNRLDMRTYMSFSILQGLSFNLNGSYSIIHDQISLPKGELTDDQLLLRKQEMETSYSFWSSVGFSYTFGSIYNNVVNPRFGY